MKIPTLALALAFTALTSSFALADERRRDRDERVSTELSGYNEVHFIFNRGSFEPPVLPSASIRGAISTKASGEFKARIDDDNQTIHYELSYKNLEGTVTQAHIHFGQKHTVGGIVAWLCQTGAAMHPVPDLGQVTPPCPTPSGTVTGIIGPQDVLTVEGQGIDAGQFRELIRAIRAGATYANVHSSVFGPGEIRGQIGHGAHSDRD